MKQKRTALCVSTLTKDFLVGRRALISTGEESRLISIHNHVEVRILWCHCIGLSMRRWPLGQRPGFGGQRSKFRGWGSVAEVWGVAKDTCTRSCTEFVAHGKSRGQFIITWGWHRQHLWVKIDPVQWKHTRLMYTTINSGVSLHLLKSNWIDF